MQNGMSDCGLVPTVLAAMITWCRASQRPRFRPLAVLTGVTRSVRRLSRHWAPEARRALAPQNRAHRQHLEGVESFLAGTPMRDALELVPIAILAIDGAGKIRFVNEKGAELFGYHSDELSGARASLLIPEWRAQGSHAVAAKHASADSALRSVIARRHDGAEFPAEITTRPCSVDGVPTLLAVVVERSERNELHRNRQELAHLTRVSALGELAGSLAHELNQPLTAILSNSQAAQRFIEADPINLREVRETLKDIVADNRRAGEIIRKMRALVRKCDMEWLPVDVGGVVRDVVSLMHSDAIVRGVRTTIEIAGALPTVLGDKVQLQQVLLNLMLNALDAVQECPAACRFVTVQAGVEPGGDVRLCVRDCGRGLTVDQMDKIFQPFFTSKPHGLGLGLSISRSIVGAHGGRVWAENNAEGGAAFYVSLPAERASGSNSVCSRP